MESKIHQIEVHNWEGEGYKPLVSHRDWLVALMNWESRFDLSGIGKVERHNETDEVFVLQKGRGILFICNQGSIQAIDMQPGVLYNVTRGAWHNVIGTRETQWLIVESNDTSEENSDYRDLENDELAALRSQFPSWLK
ncbi:MAG: hypothetical protein WBD56_18215 [Anaerolineales bacterium]